jgi:hypothetical protein
MVTVTFRMKKGENQASVLNLPAFAAVLAENLAGRSAMI